MKDEKMFIKTFSNQILKYRECKVDVFTDKEKLSILRNTKCFKCNEQPI